MVLYKFNHTLQIYPNIISVMQCPLQLTRKSTSCLTIFTDWHKMKHESSALLALCEGNPPVTDGFHKGQGPVMRIIISNSLRHHKEVIFPQQCRKVTNKTQISIFNGLLCNKPDKSLVTERTNVLPISSIEVSFSNIAYLAYHLAPNWFWFEVTDKMLIFIYIYIYINKLICVH